MFLFLPCACCESLTLANKICHCYAGFGDAVSDSVLIERTLAEVSGVCALMGRET
jgi:hypothetical protein